MKVKLYDEHTDEEISKIIEYFECEKKSSIFITFSNFLSEILDIEKLSLYFSGWEKIQYELNGNTFIDSVYYKDNSGYFFYTKKDKAVIGEFLGNDYLKCLRNYEFRSVDIPYPTTLSNFIKVCNINFIELYWNIQ
jgi:hypothetical protein